MPEEVVLAIETSQREGGVALLADAAVHVEGLRAKARHDDDLMPAIDRLFRAAGRRPGDLDAVGVSVGPGGFTGLRIAVSTAKMLALTVGARIAAVPTALVVAEGCRPDEIGGDVVLVALASKRESFWATRLARGGSGWSVDGEPGLATATSAPLEGVATLVGDEYLPDALRARCAEARVPIVAPCFEPEACLAVTRRMLDRDRTTDPMRLLPLYPRAPEAVRIWESRDR